MYDVYLNPKGIRLIVKAGASLPAEAKPGEYKKKRTVTKVSDDTKDAIDLQGYHLYKFTASFKEATGAQRDMILAAAKRTPKGKKR
jgi:hypothetical protein